MLRRSTPSCWLSNTTAGTGLSRLSDSTITRTPPLLAAVMLMKYGKSANSIGMYGSGGHFEWTIERRGNNFARHHCGYRPRYGFLCDFHRKRIEIGWKGSGDVRSEEHTSELQSR